MRLIRLLKNDLAKEITSWVSENIISTDQAEQICSRYGIDYHNQSKRSYGYFILLSLGYLFIGLAVITLLSENWESIPRHVRMAGLVSLTLAVNLFGIYKVKKDQPSAAIGAFFLGSLFYGASIMLIAQIYHIGEHFPDGIFWWAIGVLPIALFMRSTLLMILASALGFLWFFVESSFHFYPAIFPVFLAAIAWHCFRVKQNTILFLALIAGLGFWAEYSYSWMLGGFHRFEVGPDNVALGISIFIAFYGLSKWLVEKKSTMLGDYGTLLGFWTLRFALITLMVFSFEDPWYEMIQDQWDLPALTIGMAVALCALSIWLVYSARKQIGLIAGISVLYVSVLIIMAFGGNRDLSMILQIADNIVLIASGVWLISRGIQQSISHYFYMGILVILLTGLLRYIDLVGDYIGATLLFILFAVILLSSARYWRSKLSGSREVS